MLNLYGYISFNGCRLPCFQLLFVMLKFNDQSLSNFPKSAPVDKKGFLLFNKWDNYFTSGFQKRYFLLTGNLLFYFKDEDTVK